MSDSSHVIDLVDGRSRLVAAILSSRSNRLPCRTALARLISKSSETVLFMPDAL